jgi:5-methylcytosine-specific restriction endonuclease McrA
MNTVHDRAWRHLRDQVVREEPQCWLHLPGCTGTSTTADHVIPRSSRPDLTMVRSNLRGACAKCNRKRGRKSIGTIRAAIKRASEPAPALRFFN